MRRLEDCVEQGGSNRTNFGNLLKSQDLGVGSDQLYQLLTDLPTFIRDLAMISVETVYLRGDSSTLEFLQIDLSDCFCCVRRSKNPQSLDSLNSDLITYFSFRC
jgi:hypothetical protein